MLSINKRGDATFFCDSAMAWIAKVVLPDDSGPYISITLPLGKPPTPKAMSRPNEPVDINFLSFNNRIAQLHDGAFSV
jgi:hypothetical protein